MADQVKSKEGEPINEGDHVYTKYRGGRHEGDVCFPWSLDTQPLSRTSSVINSTQ